MIEKFIVSFYKEDMTMVNEEIVTTNESLQRALRMRQGNSVNIAQIPFTAEMFKMCPEMELSEVRPVYDYDENNRPILDKVSAIAYTCVDGKSWYTFKVPNQTKPLISQDEIDRREAAGNPVIVKIPLEKIAFKPYQTPNDRGTIHFSLQVPFVEIL